NEIELQELAFTNDLARIAYYRGSTWNLYVLGHLKETFLELCEDRLPQGIKPKVSTAGPGPDTILNFWWDGGDYAEINYAGRLNLKLYLEEFPDAPTKRAFVQERIDHYREVFDGRAVDFRKGGKLGNSKMIATFEIGM